MSNLSDIHKAFFKKKKIKKCLKHAFLHIQQWTWKCLMLCLSLENSLVSGCLADVSPVRSLLLHPLWFPPTPERNIHLFSCWKLHSLFCAGLRAYGGVLSKLFFPENCCLMLLEMGLSAARLNQNNELVC